jgi:hypothetical protein
VGFRFGPCGCCGGCTLNVNTTWCEDTGATCAPGTITVECHTGSTSGPVVQTQTANANGVAAFTFTSTGTYYFTASTTSSGYSNNPATVSVSSTSGTDCTPSSAWCPLYPDQLSVTDSALGIEVTVYPTGSEIGPSGTPSLDNYVGEYSAFEFPGLCSCPAETVSVIYSVTVCGGTIPQVNVWCPDTVAVHPTYPCPNNGGIGLDQYQDMLSSSGSGTGPGFSTCYPVNCTLDGFSIVGGSPLPIEMLGGSCMTEGEWDNSWTVTQ